MRDQMRDQLGDHDDLKKALVPAFRYGCKRITPHDEYLSSETGKKRVTEQYFLSIFVQKNLQLSPDPM